MTGLSALWLPILLSAVIVFVASSLVHMVLPWHKSDYLRLPDEDKVMEALRGFAIPPGDYMVPRPVTRDDLRSPAFAEKMKRGPVMVVTVMPNGPMSMGSNLGLWFVYLVGVGFLVVVHRRARAAGRHAIPPGLPVRWRDRVHRLRGGAVADVDLVPSLVDHDHQEHDRRIDLRAPHGGVLSAVAPVAVPDGAVVAGKPRPQRRQPVRTEDEQRRRQRVAFHRARSCDDRRVRRVARPAGRRIHYVTVVTAVPPERPAMRGRH